MERNEVFFDYLRAKLFEVEDNDTRVEQLTNSVKDLAEILNNQPHNVRCYTLAALDADIPIHNPLIVATNEIVMADAASVLSNAIPQSALARASGNIARGVLRGVARKRESFIYISDGYKVFLELGSPK